MVDKDATVGRGFLDVVADKFLVGERFHLGLGSSRRFRTRIGIGYGGNRREFVSAVRLDNKIFERTAICRHKCGWCDFDLALVGLFGKANGKCGKSV